MAVLWTPVTESAAPLQVFSSERNAGTEDSVVPIVRAPLLLQLLDM